jgi:hypothetical protein
MCTHPRILTTLALQTAVLLADPAAAGPEASPTVVAEHPVAAKLVTDATAIAPGGPFLAGVELRMRPGWHVYWKNPGDAGLSTELTFDLPEGFSVGPIHYPVPETFEQPGAIRGFGYAHPVILFAEITPPRSLEPGASVPIGVKVDWLACERVCIPGGAALATTLPVAEQATLSLVGEAWRSELPMDGEGIRPFIDSVRSLRGENGRVAYEVELRWLAMPPTGVEWIPDTPDAIEIEGTTVHTAGQTTRVTFEAIARTGAPLRQESMETVVAYHTADGRRQGVIVPVGLSMLAAASGS